MTGDGAVLEPDGDVRIMGRLKSDFIKTNGFRVGAGEIEDVLLSFARDFRGRRDRRAR